jgi:two-component system nitrogen regulation sensor histidine kinase GlnL
MMLLLRRSLLNFHGSASLIISLASLALGIFVYIKGKKKLQNVTYALVALAISLWSFGQFMGEISPDKVAALFWTRINLAGGILVLVFYVHFVSAFLRKIESFRWAVIAAYFFGAIYLVLDATPLFVADVEPRLIFRFYPVPGPTYPFFTLLFFFSVGFGAYELIRALPRTRGAFRNQLIYILLSSSIGFLGASTLFLPVFGIEVYPFGYYLVPVYILLGVYAIVKHRLLDITVVVRKGLVYSILAVVLSVLYVGSIYISGEIFKTVTGVGSLAPTIIVLFVFAVAFNPLRERLQVIVDKAFFKSRYDFGETIKEISAASTFVLEMDELLERILKKVVGTFGSSSGSVFLMGKGGEFRLRNKVNLDLPIGTPLGALPDFLKKTSGVLFAELVEDTSVSSEMGRIDAEVSVPLLVWGELIGFISLSKKKSEDVYSDEDVSLLLTLASHLAVAVENAALHEKILGKERELFRADKLASLGTLSAGMAHEIKNPLAIIKGLTQSLPENVDDREQMNKFVEVVPRQLDRINSLVEDLISFSKPKRVEKKDVDLNSVLKSTAALIESECRKRHIKLEVSLDEGVQNILADRELLTQAFLNLALNGMEAMGEGGVLKIESGMHDGRVEVLISDTGPGIDKDSLAHIFDPFFTTKAKGSGLGLAVTYRIITEHGGRIGVESEVGRGARFKIELS